MTADMMVPASLERQSSMDEYTMTGMLPPLGASGTTRRRPKLRRRIISPFDLRYRIWTYFLVILVFYTAWVCPFEFGYIGGTPKGILSITDNLVNGFFVVDIILTFFVAYVDKSSFVIVDDQKKIALRYAKTWLAFDLISTVPNEAVRKVLPPSLESFGYFNLLRLWRLRRVSQMFARLEKDITYSYLAVRIAKLICVNLFALHCAACIMNLVAMRYPIPSRTWMFLTMEDFHDRGLYSRYVASFYWAITTMSTTGYGDLHAVNHLEMVLDSIFMIICLGLNAYLIGNMTSLVVQITNKTRQFRDNIKAAASFARRNQLPPRLQDQMISHLCLKYRTDAEGLHKDDTLLALPKAIRSSISQHLFYPLLDNVYLFRGVSNDLLFQLVAEMKAEYFPPREDVILQNEAPTDLYIIVTGAVELSVRQNAVEEVVGEAKAGEIVGEIGVMCYRPQPYTVRTTRLSQLLRMDRTTFINIVRANIGDGTVIMNNLLQRLKDRKDPLMECILKETEQMIARGRMSVPLSLIFAAARGDDLLMNQLLKQDADDPNEVDREGRTALHISASQGNDHCIALLLEYGADPNIRDFGGSVPLWEAMLGGHKACIKLLLDNDAKLTSGEVGQFACTAVEQNNLDLLHEIIRLGGDVTLPNSSGITALHTATTEGNVEMVKFLLQQGADIDRPDNLGWTPKSLADHQGHEEIRTLFETTQMKRPHRSLSPGSRDTPRAPKPGYLRKYQTFSSVGVAGDSLPAIPETPTPRISTGRRSASSFNNSLFGVLSAVSRGEGRDLSPVPGFGSPSMLLQDPSPVPGFGSPSMLLRDPSPVPGFGSPSMLSSSRPRVTISCPEKDQDGNGKLVLLPCSLQELIDLGLSKFDFQATRVLTKGGHEIDDIELIRDGDDLILAGDAESSS